MGKNASAGACYVFTVYCRKPFDCYVDSVLLLLAYKQRASYPTKLCKLGASTTKQFCTWNWKKSQILIYMLKRDTQWFENSNANNSNLMAHNLGRFYVKSIQCSFMLKLVLPCIRPNFQGVYEGSLLIVCWTMFLS